MHVGDAGLDQLGLEDGLGAHEPDDGVLGVLGERLEEGELDSQGQLLGVFSRAGF